MKYEAVLFDMNGVIVDDEELHEAAFTDVLQSRGFDFDHESYIKYFAGKTDEAGFEAFYEAQGGGPADLEVLGTDKASAYQSLAKEGLKSYPGVLRFIEALRESGVRLALVTSSIRFEAETVLDTFDLADSFEVVIAAEDIQRSKPDPEGYLIGAKRLGVEPNRCVVIEDAPSGVAAAKKANMACLAVTNTHSNEELSGADKIVGNLEEGMNLP